MLDWVLLFCFIFVLCCLHKSIKELIKFKLKANTSSIPQLSGETPRLLVYFRVAGDVDELLFETIAFIQTPSRSRIRRLAYTPWSGGSREGLGIPAVTLNKMAFPRVTEVARVRVHF